MGLEEGGRGDVFVCVHANKASQFALLATQRHNFIGSHTVNV